MAYSNSNGLIMVATGYSGGTYTYTKLSYKYIQQQGLSITPDIIQDLDSYRNGNGYLVRHILPHKSATIDWVTPYLQYDDKCNLMTIIKNGFNLADGECSEDERKIRIKYFNDFSDSYNEGHFYLPDTKFQYGGVFNQKPMYMPVTLSFVKY